MSVSNGFDVRGRKLQAGELAAWLAEHSLGNRFGLAVLGAGGARQAKAEAVAIVAADGDGRYIDVAALIPDDEAALAAWLADPGPPKAVHDAKPAMHALAGRGWTLRGVTSDTVLAAWLLRPAPRSPSLNDLLIRHMRCALPTENVGPEHYSSLILSACAVLDLADVLDEELARIDSSSLLTRVELPVQRVLAEMETVGIAVDRAVLARSAAGLLNSIAADGRIHPTFHQTSGRISAADPNLAAIRELRGAFIAGEGYAGLLTASYRQLETRLPAAAAAPPGPRGSAGLVKLAMINVNEAIHGLQSRMVFHVDDEFVFEVADGEREALAELVREQMKAAYPLDRPLDPPLEVALAYSANLGGP